MRSTVYVTVGLSVVRLSVPAWAHSSKPAAAGLLCGPDGQEISIDCCTAGAQLQRRANAGQCHIISVRRKLNTDLYLIALRRTFVMEVVDSMYQSWDNYEITVGIFLDLQKALDTVNYIMSFRKNLNYMALEVGPISF